jgi:hypothetical protein
MPIRDIYRQLARMPAAFSVKCTQVAAQALTVTKLVDANTLRAYIAFRGTAAGAGDILMPDQILNNNFGFLIIAAAFNEEFWMEKHKAMVQGKWQYNRVTAGISTVSIVEMFYQSPD